MRPNSSLFSVCLGTEGGSRPPGLERQWWPPPLPRHTELRHGDVTAASVTSSEENKTYVMSVLRDRTSMTRDFTRFLVVGASQMMRVLAKESLQCSLEFHTCTLVPRDLQDEGRGYNLPSTRIHSHARGAPQAWNHGDFWSGKFISPTSSSGSGPTNDVVLSIIPYFVPSNCPSGDASCQRTHCRCIPLKGAGRCSVAVAPRSL